MVKKFTIPFASQGDANDIPDALQVDGKVSFTQGFGYDYERPYDDPQAKDIAREDMNGLFKAITSAVGELQTLGASEWSSAISYPKGAIVYFEKDLYISQADDNQNKPPKNWVSITSIANDSLKKAANLSDLTNKATARSNLGLGSSATLNKTDVLGTSSNLVATQKLVNDTKVNLENSINAVEKTSKKFLVKSSNLSDLTNKTTARNNLGLGSSATLNKTDVLGTSTSLVATQKLVNDTKVNLESSKQDKLTFIGSGKVMREGAFGLGSLNRDPDSINNSGFYYIGSTPYKGMPKAWVAGTVTSGMEEDFVSAFQNITNGELYLSGVRLDEEIPLRKVYDTINTTVDSSGFLRASGSANALTTSDVTQLLGTSTTLVASQALVNSLAQKIDDVPVDKIFAFDRAIPPAGYIARNGQAIDKNTMPKLYARYGANMPDDRNRVHRMQGSLTGAVGSTQEDGVQMFSGKLGGIVSRGGTFDGGVFMKGEDSDASYKVEPSQTRFHYADRFFELGNLTETRVKSRIVIFCNKIQ